MRLLGFIPARSGSVRVPDKNARPLGGDSLIARAVRGAVGATSLDAVGFSSDSDAYRRLAADAGLSDDYRRPAHLAGNEATTTDAILDYVAWRDGRDGAETSHVVLLQTTNPFRDAAMIDAAVTFWKSSGRPSLATVTEAAANPRFVVSRNRATGVQVREGKDDDRDIYVLDGAVFVTPLDMIRETGRVWNEDSALFVNSYPCAYDIDTEADFAAAAALLSST